MIHSSAKNLLGMPLLWDSSFHQRHVSMETQRDGNMKAVKTFSASL